MSNDCTYVNQLTKNKNIDSTDDNSSDVIYQKINDYQLNIKVDGKLGVLIIVVNFNQSKSYRFRRFDCGLSKTYMQQIACIISDKK